MLVITRYLFPLTLALSLCLSLFLLVGLCILRVTCMALTNSPTWLTYNWLWFVSGICPPANSLYKSGSYTDELLWECILIVHTHQATLVLIVYVIKERLPVQSVSLIPPTNTVRTKGRLSVCLSACLYICLHLLYNCMQYSVTCICTCARRLHYVSYSVSELQQSLSNVAKWI